MIRHISVNIDYLLTLDDKKLSACFEGTPTRIRKELLERKSNGEVKIGSDNCEGFDPVFGCPGHLPKILKRK